MYIINIIIFQLQICYGVYFNKYPLFSSDKFFIRHFCRFNLINIPTCFFIIIKVLDGFKKIFGLNNSNNNLYVSTDIATFTESTNQYFAKFENRKDRLQSTRH